MNIHPNARLTPHGRTLMVSRILDEGWRVADAAAAAGLSERRAYEGLRRFRAGGARPPGPELDARRLAPCRAGRKSRPNRALAAPAADRRGHRRQARACRARPSAASCAGSGSAVWPRSTPSRRSSATERERPGELIHIDTKKLGRIEASATASPANRRRPQPRRRLGRRACLRRRRLAPGLQRDPARRAQDSAMPSSSRALAWFVGHGVTVERVMTDNGSAYRSHALPPGPAAARPAPHPHPALHAAHQRQGRALHPDQPARMGLRPTPISLPPSATRAMQPWITAYNHTRPHSALGGQPPINRLDNVLGFAARPASAGCKCPPDSWSARFRPGSRVPSWAPRSCASADTPCSPAKAETAAYPRSMPIRHAVMIACWAISPARS